MYGINAATTLEIYTEKFSFINIIRKFDVRGTARFLNLLMEQNYKILINIYFVILIITIIADKFEFGSFTKFPRSFKNKT